MHLIREGRPRRRAGTETHRAVDAPAVELPDIDVDLVLRAVTNPGAKHELKPVQVRALAEAKRAGGLLGAIGVGRGKQLVVLLVPTVLEAERPVLLCPPGLVDTALAEYVRFRRSFALRDDLAIVPYSMLSRPEHEGVLEELRPDLIVADEVQHIRRIDSARTRRVLRYIAEHPWCRFVGVSGTLMGQSLRDFAHLAEAALRERAPVPRSGGHLSSWCAVIDADGEPLDRDFAVVRDLVDRWGRPEDEGSFRERARAALRRRLAITPGVVMTRATSCDASLVIRLVREPRPSLECVELMALCRETGATPDGERVFASDEEAVKAARQLALGFYYTWDWDGSPWVDRNAWLDARSEHARMLRAVLSAGQRGLDSPKLVRDAVDSGDPRVPRWYSRSLERWREVESLCDPATRAVWVDRSLVEHAAQWLDKQREPAVLWFRDRAFGRALADMGIDVRSTGADAPTTAGKYALSLRAFQEGHNFQTWCRLCRVVGLPSSNDSWEQPIGRFHRDGQPADVVVCDAYVHHATEAAALRRARRKAQALEQGTGAPTKLGVARYVEYTDAPSVYQL